MTRWTDHCKNYQSQHGCSYKEALKRAGATYQKEGDIEGGKFNLKKALHKGAKKYKKGKKMLEKNQDLVKFAVGDEYSGYVDKALKASNKIDKYADEIETQTGAGFGKHFGRKLKHSVGKARKITKKVVKNVDKYGLPIAEMVAPEFAPELMAASAAVKRVNGGSVATLGSTRNGKRNPYMNGGSFTTPGYRGGSFNTPGYHGGCTNCQKHSDLLPYSHQAFNPKPPKSYSEIMMYN